MEQNGQKKQGHEDLPEQSEQPGQQEERQDDVLYAEVVEDAEQATEAVQQELREVQQKAEEYLDLLRRTQADFVN
ncbi:MAG TPA: hypothetical protein VHD63_00075, partial [Ktedonobacteraceae bacterium]|nr:hypothetical protein [Ktedonobacteraceae bacterium]